MRLQRTPKPLRGALEELSMRTVIEHLSEKSVEIPSERTLIELPETDVRRQRQRLLRAHELLADLNEDNRAKFIGVVNALRNEGSE